MRTAFGEIRIPVCIKVESREDGMELVELDNRIHVMLVHMSKLVLDMINGSKEELEILDMDIDWEVVVNKDGTDHSWFEIVDGVRHLRIADEVNTDKVGEDK